jgi:hypothetical protein
MTSDTRKNRIGRCGPVALSAIAIILVAAATGYDANWERLRGMPADQRERLLGNLRRFDLELTPEQQSAARELDRRLSDMGPEQRAQYLAVLRRYHDWLNSLPENRQGEVTAKLAGERLALVRKLIAEWRVPTGDTPPLLAGIELGGLSAFELASAYKIWRELEPEQKAALERISQERPRREELFRKGARLKPPIPRETQPDDFDEEKWIGLLQEHLRKDRPILLAETKVDDQATEPMKVFRHNLLKRRAINLYVREARGIRSVAPDRLARFVGSLPAWIQSAIDPLPPDESTRRLTFAYRLVFPDKEIGMTPQSAGTPTKGNPAPVPRPPTPQRPKTKAAQPGESAEPF